VTNSPNPDLQHMSKERLIQEKERMERLKTLLTSPGFMTMQLEDAREFRLSIINKLLRGMK